MNPPMSRPKSRLKPTIQKLYADALDAPLSSKAHNLLHTTYQAVPPAYTF